MTKVDKKSAIEEEDKSAPETAEETDVEEETPVGDPAPEPVDPFLNRKAARLAAVQLQVDGPKLEPASAYDEETTEEEEEK